MNILDFSTTHTQETDEIINVSDSNPINLSHDIFYNKTGKLVTIFTGSGEGGTELSEGSDFDVTGVFPDGSLPESISPDVAYTTIEITNDEYHDTDLYVNYYPIGDVISAARWNVATLPGQVDEVSSDTTISERTALRIVQVTTGGTDRTITLPDLSDMEFGDEIEVAKVDSGSGKVEVAADGSDTIEGAASIALPSQYNNACLRASDGYWAIVSIKANYDTGEVAISDWRNQTISITHNLGARASDLSIEFWGQTSADTGGDFVKLGTVSYDGGDSTKRQMGYSIYEVDDNSLQILTPDYGPFVVEPDKDIGGLGDNNGEYRVVVRRVD